MSVSLGQFELLRQKPYEAPNMNHYNVTIFNDAGDEKRLFLRAETTFDAKRLAVAPRPGWYVMCVSQR